MSRLKFVSMLSAHLSLSRLRRVITLVLVLSITACGGGDGDEEESSGQPSPVPTETAQSETPSSTPAPVPTPALSPTRETNPTAVPEPSPTPVPAVIPTPTPAPAAEATPNLPSDKDPTPTPMPTPEPEPELVEHGYEIVDTYPHDPRAFTQGLEYRDGYLFESTGLRGESSLRRVDLESGEVLQIRELDEQYFGEGMTILDDRIFLLTWQAGAGFVYDREMLEPVGEFSYEGEGWGLTSDGERLIMSDGSHTLSFRDPETFEEIGRVDVYDNDGPVMMLNELEYIDGRIWANVWLSDVIVVIDPATGRVTGRIDLTGLLQPEDQQDRRVDVLNGIAHDPDTGRTFVTGKLWPVMYEIELIAGDQ